MSVYHWKVIFIMTGVKFYVLFFPLELWSDQFLRIFCGKLFILFHRVWGNSSVLVLDKFDLIYSYFPKISSELIFQCYIYAYNYCLIFIGFLRRVGGKCIAQFWIFKREIHKMCLDLTNSKHIYAFEKLNISQSVYVCFNLLSLMTVLGGVHGFSEPFARIPQPWNLKPLLWIYSRNTVVRNGRNIVPRWYLLGVECFNLLVSYSKTILGISRIIS